MEDTHRLAPLQALLLLVRELLLHGIEARGDSKTAKGCLVAVRTTRRCANIAPVFDVGCGEEVNLKRVSKDGRQGSKETGDVRAVQRRGLARLFDV